MSCGVQLRWYDMIPVFSWIALRGRCRACRAHISFQYPLVEAATSILFATVGFWISFGLSWSGIALVILYLLILALLVCIAAYDMLHTIIPDEWAYCFAALAFVSQFLLSFSAELNPWWFFLAGPTVAAPLFGLWFFSRGMWMGLGDVKLALGIGWLLGPVTGILAVFFAFVIGAFVSVPLIFFSSHHWKKFVERFTPTAISRRLAWGFTMKSEIPFGPFLILSCIIIWFASLYGIDSLHTFELLLWSSSL